MRSLLSLQNLGLQREFAVDSVLQAFRLSTTLCWKHAGSQGSSPLDGEQIWKTMNGLKHQIRRILYHPDVMLNKFEDCGINIQPILFVGVACSSPKSSRPCLDPYGPTRLIPKHIMEVIQAFPMEVTMLWNSDNERAAPSMSASGSKILRDNL